MLDKQRSNIVVSDDRVVLEIDLLADLGFEQTVLQVDKRYDGQTGQILFADSKVRFSCLIHLSALNFDFFPESSVRWAKEVFRAV